MARLSVTLKLHDAVYHTASVVLHDGMRLGDDVRAAVSFVGADWVVRATPDGWRVAGQPLVSGERVHRVLGDVVVELELLDALDAVWLRGHGPDLVPLMLTAALLVGLAAYDTLVGVVRADPALAYEVASLVLPLEPLAEDTDQAWPQAESWSPPVGYVDAVSDAR